MGWLWVKIPDLTLLSRSFGQQKAVERSQRVPASAVSCPLLPGLLSSHWCQPISPGLPCQDQACTPCSLLVPHRSGAAVLCGAQGAPQGSTHGWERQPSLPESSQHFCDFMGTLGKQDALHTAWRREARFTGFAWESGISWVPGHAVSQVLCLENHLAAGRTCGSWQRCCTCWRGHPDRAVWEPENKQVKKDG